MRALCCVLCCLALQACVPSGVLRPADVASYGEVRVGFTWTATFGWGHLDEGGTWTRHMTGSLVGSQGSILLLALFTSVELNLAVGVGKSCEMGMLLGFTRAGAESRCQLTGGAADGTSARWATAAAVMGGYSLVDRGPWGRAGIDVSRWFESGAGLLTNLYVSYGGGHAELVPKTLEAGLFDGRRATPTVGVSRREVRINTMLGVLTPPDPEEGLQAMFGIAPYYTAWAGPATLTCSLCAGSPTFAFREKRGFSLMQGYRF